MRKAATVYDVKYTVQHTQLIMKLLMTARKIVISFTDLITGKRLKLQFCPR